ncbi:hypothetical protein LI328DRAFT_45690 [Trichoderma asperelloides]|nr:hypothetical protein LI328DRAFT_45690 [Trichoderma asperelloides]
MEKLDLVRLAHLRQWVRLCGKAMGFFSFWCSATCIISTLSPSLTYYVQEICYPNPSIDSLFPGHDNTTYDERAAAGTHLTVLRWIRRSDFVVFRSNITKLGPNMDGVCMNG